MAESIEVEVGSFHAGLHEDLSQSAGEQYEEYLRQTVEETIHEVLQQVERQRDAMEEQNMAADDGEIEELDLDETDD